MQPPPSQPTRFTWPPRKPASSAPTTTSTSSPDSHPKASSPSQGRRDSLWSAIEHTWLDLRAGPLPDRAAESHWSPDDPADYCPRCGRSAKPGATDPTGCAECRGITLVWSRLVRLGEFAGPLRTWIHEVKYTRWRRLGHDLGVLLGERLLEAHGAASLPDQLPTLLVPIPDASLRRIIRGIDHTMVICRGVQAVTGWEIAQPLVRRFGQSQVAVAPSERAANVAKSFGLRSGFGGQQLGNRRIVLVDDVCTTGSTLRTCSRHIQTAFRRAKDKHDKGPEIWVAVLGRTQPPEQGANTGKNRQNQPISSRVSVRPGSKSES